MGIASVTAISCSHMLHFIKLCSYQFTTDLPLPSTLEAFKFNLSKIDLLFLSDSRPRQEREAWRRRVTILPPIFHFHQLRKLFKLNLPKIELVRPSIEPWTFGMAARIADHKATVDMFRMRESMSRMVAPNKHSFM